MGSIPILSISSRASSDAATAAPLSVKCEKSAKRARDPFMERARSITITSCSRPSTRASSDAASSKRSIVSVVARGLKLRHASSRSASSGCGGMVKRIACVTITGSAPFARTDHTSRVRSSRNCSSRSGGTSWKIQVAGRSCSEASMVRRTRRRWMAAGISKRSFARSRRRGIHHGGDGGGPPRGSSTDFGGSSPR
ncbi:MAG: hypothetical protein ACREON_19080 [Gemmatimonadaceae bacterium]